MDENQRFRRALKNPLVTMGLCVLAGFAVYANVMDATFDEPGIISAGINRLLSAPTLPPLILTGRPHEKEARQWTKQPRRDPFAPFEIAYQVQSDSPSMAEPVNFRKLAQTPHELILKAIAVEGEQRSAIINRTVVYEGEMIEGYQVMSIQPKGVWLKYQGKTQWLTFSEKATS